MTAVNKKPARSAWTRSTWAGYAFAVAATGLAFALRSETNWLTGDRIPLILCAGAAVIATVWRAGFGPALAASFLTTVWYVLDDRTYGSAGPHPWIHYGLYMAEAGFVCIYGRQLRTARGKAARGEDWQRHVVETAGEGIWMIDPHRVIVYANPRMAEILGCGTEQIAGRRMEDFLFPDDLPVERVRTQRRRLGVRDQFDRRLRRMDGSEVWVLACSGLYSYGTSDVVSLTMMTDITERKNAEQALRQSERKYRELFENVLEGVYQTSPDGRILAANPELLRMLGFSSQEELNVPGVVRETFVQTELHESLRDRLQRDGSYTNVEFQLRTRDGRVITVRENARVVRDENGNVLYYEGTLTDITEQIRLETQLRQAQKMEALGRLAGGIARDFRSIGAAMANGLQQALDVLPEESLARPRLDVVARSIHSADALTRQILDFSKRQTSGSGGPLPEDAAMDLNALVAHLEPSLRKLVKPGNSLALSLSERAMRVPADPAVMRQIVTSLVAQAGESGSGERAIDLTTSIEPVGPANTTGPFAVLSVRGNADGGDAEEFHPWIGMATTQAILAQFGGMMTATLERLAGAPDAGGSRRAVRYSLYLPMAAGEGQLQAASASARKSGSVLLVEEEPLIRELSRDMLERQGFRVLAAGNAAEAERIARSHETFDVLITAWTKDGRSGAAFARSLRDMRPGLRVLFVAGYADDSAHAIAAPDGSSILQKPFSGDSLGRKVRLLLDRPDGVDPRAAL